MKRLTMCVLMVLSAGFLPPHLSRAADPEFVGIMALVLEKDVAKQLGLSQAEYEKLFNWVDDRELSATDLVLSLRDKPDEQREKLKQFAAESEQLGLEMLSLEQRKRLQQLFLERQGLGSLGRLEMQDKLNLDDQQRDKVAKLMADREEALAKAAASQKAATQAYFERKLAGVLSDKQRLDWEKLSGQAAPDALVADAGNDATAEENNPADEGDAATPASDDNRNDQPSPPVVAEDTGVAAAPPEVERPRRPDGEIKLRFNFRHAPWQTVLEWFADQADLSLELANTPEGTLNYTDRRDYTPAEAIDMLNSVLLTKGYTLVRHRRMLMVINLEDGIPPNLIETVPVEELDDRGRYELVSALFKLDELTAEDAENEVRKLLGPQGSIVVLPKTQALLITETGGRLRVIRDLLKAAEKPEEVVDEKVNEIALEYALAEEVLGVVRQLMGLPEDRNAAADGSLRIATDTLGTRLFVTGSDENVKKVREIVKLMEVPDGLDGAPGVIETPQLEVYSITSADPESVLKVMQTLMAGESGVRLDIDPKTGHLVALARPSQHATIKATINQMQRDGRLIEVIQLRVVDPQVAVLSINKLFGVSEEGGNDRAPVVDADPVAAQLLIRGTESQVEQIRALMEKMGESGFEEDSALAQVERGNVRMIPLTGGSARSALEQLETVWPSIRRNKIRVVSPSAAVREMRNGSRREDISPSRGAPLELPADLDDLNELFQRFEIQPRQPAESGEQPKSEPPPSNESRDPQAGASPQGGPFRFAAERHLLAQAEGDSEGTSAPPSDLTIPAQPPAAEGEGTSRPGADIIVAPGPGGILIASEDLDALDEFEELLQTFASRGTTEREYTVFYLKYARADVAAELLTDILGGGGGGGAADAGGGGLFGDLASAALGNAGGGLVGSLLGLGGGGGGGAISTSGSVTMVADRRLNALVIEANNEDLDLVEQLLEVIDQEASPEDVQTFARPRLIPVFYTSADEIANVVKQVYAERLTGAGGNANRNRQPSPEEFMRALRGGRGGRGGGGGGSAQDEEQKMTVGVDARSNSLVVSAPEPLFQEIKTLVEQLDQAGAEETETVVTRTLKNASPDLVRKAIVSITGGNVTTGTSAASQPAGAAATASQNGGGQAAQTPEQMRDQIRQRIELFNALQRQGQQGGGAGGGPASGGRPSSGARGGADAGGRGFGGGRGTGGGQPGGGLRSGGGLRPGGQRGGR